MLTGVCVVDILWLSVDCDRLVSVCCGVIGGSISVEISLSLSDLSDVFEIRSVSRYDDVSPVRAEQFSRCCYGIFAHN